jgi:AcrR family transcriptional regulator
MSKDRNSAENRTRLDQRRQARKRIIIRAAGAELAGSGYRGANLEDIARSVHITKATLYHYFKTKEELYQAWMDQVSSEVSTRFEEAIGDGPPAEKLWRLVKAEVFILLTDLGDYGWLLRSGLDWPSSLEVRLAKLRHKHELYFQAVIQDGIDAGEFKVETDSLARRCLRGAIAYVPEWYDAAGPLGAREVAEAVANIAVRMLCINDHEGAKSAKT